MMTKSADLMYSPNVGEGRTFNQSPAWGSPTDAILVFSLKTSSSLYFSERSLAVLRLMVMLTALCVTPVSESRVATYSVLEFR